jgi:hypothetical protein
MVNNSELRDIIHRIAKVRTYAANVGSDDHVLMRLDHLGTDMIELYRLSEGRPMVEMRPQDFVKEANKL